MIDFETASRKRNITWEIHLLPPLWADRVLLRMVLVSLISNTLKFLGSHFGSKIEIGCIPTEDDETIIFVRDNGIGFDSEDSEKLFDGFQRALSGRLDDRFSTIKLGGLNLEPNELRSFKRVYILG